MSDNGAINIGTSAAYKRWSQIPYEVFLSEKDKKINPSVLSKILFDAYQSVTRTEMLDNRRMKVFFKSQTEANHIVNNPKFTLLYKVNTNASPVEVSGVVYIPFSENLQSLQSDGKGGFSFADTDKLINLNSVVRLRRKIPNTFKEYEDSKLVKVTFPGTLLPDYIQFNNRNISVRPFLNVPKFCVNGYRLNYSKNYCNYFKCSKCSEIRQKDETKTVTSTMSLKNQKKEEIGEKTAAKSKASASASAEKEIANLQQLKELKISDKGVKTPNNKNKQKVQKVKKPVEKITKD